MDQLIEPIGQPIEKVQNLKPVIVGGQDLTRCRAHFDLDDGSIVTASGRQLSYYSLESCEQTSQASIASSKLKIDENIVSSEKLDSTLYVFTSHGHVFLWNLETRDWINQLSLPLSDNETLISCKMLSKRQYIYAIKDNPSNETTLYYSMARSERERPKQRELIGHCSHGAQTSFDIGCVASTFDLNAMDKMNREKEAKQRVVAFFKGSFIFFQHIGIGEKFYLEKSHQRIDNHHFTCVRANHTSPQVAGGDNLGRIYLYSGDFRRRPNRTKLHWHSLPVNDLCFSSTGRTLFSVGGESGCVVEWDLAQNNIGSKNVIPRLGMPIRLINCSQNLNLLVLSFIDNEIQFMDTSRETRKLKTFTRRAYEMYTRGSKRKGPLSTENSIGLQWHSKTDSIVTNSRPGRLQFYAPKKRSRLQMLNFLKTDILTLEREGKVTPSDITRAAFTIDGNWIAFYETRDQKDCFPDVKLHFWQRSTTTGRWGWIQTASRVHESASIVDLKFSPNGQYLISLCQNGTFHIFHRVCLDAKSNSSKFSTKQMYARGFTGQVPEHQPAMAAFSQDSTVLAISLKNDTTLLWMIVDAYKLVYELQLNQVLITDEVMSNSNRPPKGHKVLGLHFGHHEPQSIAPLCEVRSNAIRIWNILSPQEKVEYFPESTPDKTLDESQLIAAAFDQNRNSQTNGYFAVSAKNNIIYIFRMLIDTLDRRLTPIIAVDASPPTYGSSGPGYFTNMCFLNEPIVEIDEQCLADQGIVRLISRLCLMTNNQELMGITDKLTLERETSSNNCNQVKTVAKSDLLVYFEKSASIYDEETRAFRSNQKTDSVAVTEKQRRIRNRLQAQKMLKELMMRVPSHNLPDMETLGPMILNRLI